MYRLSTIVLMFLLLLTSNLHAAIEVKSDGVQVKKVESLNFIDNTITTSGNTATIVDAPQYYDAPVAMLLGDSHMARNFTQSATDDSFNNYGWINHANVLMGQAFNYSNTTDSNQGVNGDTTALVLARASTWKNINYDVVFISIGTNDIWADGLTGDEVIAGIQSILALIPENKQVVFMPLMPRTFVDSTKVLYALQVNKWLYEEQFARKNFVFVKEAIDAVINPTNTNYEPASGMLDSGSSVHFNNYASYLIGKAIYNRLHTKYPGHNYMVSSAADDYAVISGVDQILPSPVLAGSSGTKTATGGGTAPSGTVATGFTVDHNFNSTADSVCSVVARTVAADGDAIGSNQVIVIGGVTPMAANDKFQFRSAGSITTGVQPGDYIEAWADIKVSGVSKILSVAMWVQAQTDGGTLKSAYDLRHTTTDVELPTDFTGGIYKTARVQVPTGTTLNSVQLRIEVRAATTSGGTITLKIGRPTIRVVR